MAQFYDDKVPDGLLLAFSSYGMRHGKNISPVGTGVRALYQRRITLACPSFIEHFLGGGFKHFLFSPLLGEDSHFD